MNSRLFLFPLILFTLLAVRLSSQVVVEDRMGLRPPPDEYPGTYAYRAELMKAEAAYKERVQNARKAYLKEIREFQKRARLTKEAAARFNAEVDRVENLPDPVVVSQEPVKQSRPRLGGELIPQ